MDSDFIAAEFEAIDVSHDGEITRPELEQYTREHNWEPKTVNVSPRGNFS